MNNTVVGKLRGWQERRRLRAKATPVLFVFLGAPLIFLHLQAGRPPLSSPEKTGPAFVLRGDRPGAGTPGSSLIEFGRLETENCYELVFRWEDFHRRVQSLKVSIPRDVLHGEEETFGCEQGQISVLLEKEADRLRESGRAAIYDLAERLIKASGYGSCLALRMDEEKGLVLDITSPPKGELAKIRAAIKGISAKIGRERDRLEDEGRAALERQRRAYLESRGLKLRRDKKVEVDYLRCVTRSIPAMREIARVLWQGVVDRPSERLERALSFVQSLDYALPPVVENGKDVLGFWVPTRVLVDGRGDCDSKAVLFAALWLSTEKEHLALIKVPNHVLLGIANLPGGGKCLIYHGIEFNLFEVSGGGAKFPPGTISREAYEHLVAGRSEVEILN